MRNMCEQPSVPSGSYPFALLIGRAKGSRLSADQIAFLPGRPMFRRWRARAPISRGRCISGFMTMLMPIFFAHLLHLFTLGIGQYLAYIVAHLGALNRQVGHQVAALSCQCL